MEKTMPNQKKPNRHYTVWGDMTSDKSSENYPEKVLCEDCAGDYEIVTTGSETNEACEDCGGPESD
jgi:hypothetical protein